MIDMTNKNIFQKAQILRKLATHHFGRELSKTEMKSVLSKANCFARGKTKTLDPHILGFLGKLQDNKIKPDTAYKYFLVSELPPNMKEKIYARKISVRRAVAMFSDEKERRRIELEGIVFEYGMKALEGLNYGKKNT